MTTRFVTVGDDLTLPASVVVPAGQVDGLDAKVTELAEDPTSDLGASLSNTYVPRAESVGTVSLPSGARLTALPAPLNNRNRQNLAAFIQDNVTTVGDRQFAVWVNESMNPVVGLRQLGYDEWETFDLSTLAGNPLGTPVNNDGHNDYVIAVDADGYIHVAGDMHAHPLHYVRSLSPWDITAWEAPGMVGGLDETRISYPQFTTRLNGELLFIYRETLDLGGGLSAGATVVNAYNTTTRTWSRRSIPIDGRVGVTKSSPYTNRIAVGPDDSLHIFYMWRPTAGSANDPSIGHIRSLDGGATWVRMDGSAVTLPVTRDDHVGVAVIYAANQQGADVDANGIPHAAFVSNKGNGLAIRHLYWSGATWVVEVVIDHSIEYGSLARAPRASLFCRGADTFLIYATGQAGAAGGGGQSLRIRNLGASDRHVDFALIEANIGHFEPTFDHLSLRNRDELTMLVTTGQPESAALVGLDPPKQLRAWGAILTFPLTLTRVAAGLDDGPVRNERVWIPASQFTANEGTPAQSLVSESPVWEMPDAATSSVVALTYVPDRWQAVNVDLWWANGSAAAGNVRYTVTLNRAVSGVALSSTAVTTWQATTVSVTATAGALEIPVVTRMVTARPVVTFDADRLFRVRVRRVGADAADTLAGKALFLGAMLSPSLLP